jgi:hypothetical protein
MLTHFITIPPMGVWNMHKEEEEEGDSERIEEEESLLKL